VILVYVAIIAICSFYTGYEMGKYVLFKRHMKILDDLRGGRR